MMSPPGPRAGNSGSDGMPRTPSAAIERQRACLQVAAELVTRSRG